MESRAHRWTQGCLVLLLVLALLGGPITGRADPKVEFHIDAGDAASTLTEFSRQARLQLLFDYNIIKGHTTRAINGLYDPSEALRQMLADTNLMFDFVNPRTLTVTPMRGGMVAGGPRSRTQSRPTQRARAQRSGNGDLSLDGGNNPLEEVRVTGTNLRGELPVGAQVLTFDRIAIEESGASTVAGFLRTLPQTFG